MVGKKFSMFSIIIAITITMVTTTMLLPGFDQKALAQSTLIHTPTNSGKLSNVNFCFSCWFVRGGGSDVVTEGAGSGGVRG